MPLPFLRAFASATLNLSISSALLGSPVRESKKASLCIFSSASFCSVISVMDPATLMGLPSSSHIAIPLVLIHFMSPLPVFILYSTWRCLF